jgi:guanylate kinase
VSRSRTSREGADGSGLLIVLCGPSGTGKSTILREVFARDPRLAFSVSHTTRPPRAGEEDGVAYHFVADADFDKMVAEGAFAEWAHVHGRRYGTAHAEVRRLLAAGHDVVFDIDVQGAENLCKVYPEAISVFLLPPSLSELEARLRGRGTETEANLELRLGNARREIARAGSFQYFVVNTSIDAAASALSAVIAAERLKSTRHHDLPTRLLDGEVIASQHPTGTSA